MKQLIFLGAMLVFLARCEESDNQNAKYIKNIEKKNNQLERELRKKNELEQSDSTENVIAPAAKP